MRSEAASHSCDRLHGRGSQDFDVLQTCAPFSLAWRGGIGDGIVHVEWEEIKHHAEWRADQDIRTGLFLST